MIKSEPFYLRYISEGSFNIFCKLFGHKWEGIDDMTVDMYGNIGGGQARAKLCERCGKCELTRFGEIEYAEELLKETP